MTRFVPVAVLVLAATIVVACGSTAAQGPQLATLTAHGDSSTVLPITSGKGSKDLGSVTITGAVGIDLTCAGSGKATATLVPLGEQVGAICNGSGSSTAGAVFPKLPAGKADLRITAAADTTWTVSIYYPEAGLLSPVTGS